MSDDSIMTDEDQQHANVVPVAESEGDELPCEFQGGPDVVAVADVQPEEEVAPAVGPVRPEERVSSVDVLRGVALLGILAMNIASFGAPGSVYSNPQAGRDDWGLNDFLWTFNHLIFDTKMMSLFSMLFGAGLVLMGDRADAKGRKFAWFYYRRVLWLLAIGLAHAYLIWTGDILVLYAQCGLLLYPLRKLAPHRLLILGICLELMMIPIFQGVLISIEFMKDTAARVETMEKAGEAVPKWRKKVGDFYKKSVEPNMKPNYARANQARDEELRAYRGNYGQIVSHRAGGLFMEHTIGFILGGWWFVGGRMLIGMAMMKLGVFAASRSRSFYLGMMALGYGLGMPLVIADTVLLYKHHFGGEHMMRGGFYLNFYGGLLVALGHAALVMLVYQSGRLKWLTRRLAAVGRMALSNYLFDSILCTFIFYGYGLSLFGMLDRAGLYAIVIAIWTFQLIISPIWLEQYRFGPAEWVWRSLTYWKPQPMRVQPVAA